MKLYSTISEVSGITGLEPYVLRRLEANFSQLRPKKNGAGVRAYRERDIELIKRIKSLLYDENLTVQEARTKITCERRNARDCGRKNTNENATANSNESALDKTSAEPIRTARKISDNSSHIGRGFRDDMYKNVKCELEKILKILE